LFGDRANFSELFSCLKNVDAHGTLQALAVDPLFSNGPLTGSKDLKNRSEDLFFNGRSHFHPLEKDQLEHDRIC